MGRRKKSKERRGQPSAVKRLNRALRNLTQKEILPMFAKTGRKGIWDQYKIGGLKLAEAEYKLLIAQLPIAQTMYHLKREEAEAIKESLGSLMRQLREKATSYKNN